MRIKRLKLTGFKSFVDPTELRIERGLTGVVGPNGCGKSNLLEAIRWVMGESSAKSMRGGGMEDVIFAGTAARPERQFAEVSMLVERQGAQGDEEGEVVRRIERGAGSAYRMDGRDVRAKDVALLFADAATGAHSPALVSQGRIAAVIAAKPAERRLMLEEAAGIAGLHVRRKDAEQRLRATETNLSRLDELLADMEQRGGALRRQVRAAERYRTLSTSLRLAEAKLIFARWRDAATAAEAAKREAEAAEQRVAAAAEVQRAGAAALTEASHRVADARAATLSARDAAAAATRLRDATAAERVALDRRVAELSRQIAALEADKARETALGLDATTALSALEAEQQALGSSVAAAEAALPTLRPRRETAEAAMRAAEQVLAEAMTAEATALGEARLADAALAAARARRDRAEVEARRLDQERAALGDGAVLDRERNAAAAAREAAEAEARGCAGAATAGEEAREAAEATRTEAAGRLATAEAELAALQAEQRVLAASASKATGGRAIDAIRAEPGYERALAAALGDDLQAVVGDGLRGWRGAESDGDPALAALLEPLARHVTAPPQLARRLAQIGVVDADEGQTLAVGQRLVTRGGALRRWDGFAAREGANDAAERLIRANRLDALANLLPAAQERVREANAERQAAVTALAEATAAIDAARKRRSAAEQAARTAIQLEDRAAAAIERLADRRTALDERGGRVGDELATARADHDRAAAVSAALPSLQGVSEQVAVRRREADIARGASAALMAEETGLARGLAADSSRRIAAGQEADQWRARAGAATKRIEEMAARAAALLVEAETMAAAPAELDARAAREAESARALSAEADAARRAEGEAELGLRTAEATQGEAAELLAQARELRASAFARKDSEELRRVEMSRIAGERFECPAPLLPERAGFDSADVQDAATESSRLERLAAERERLGPVNLVAEQELAELDAERVKSAAERAELGEAVNRLRGSIGSLNREGRARLLAAFQEVDGHFRRLFSTLFGGGEAHLALVDADDPLEAGLEIMAQPPGKRLSALTLLSGGEQALTAVALIFALFLTNPAPICVLDEVDAPLDDANVERFCDLLDRMTEETDTRYLIVTHNAVTMSRMHRLFGVTMVERGVSRLVSVDLGGAERLLAAAE